MLVLVDSPVKVDFYVQDVPEVAWDLIELADKPLTIIYSGARNLAPNLLAEDGSVGIRVSEISEDIKSAVDYIVGYRQEETGRPKPSSIIKLGKGGVIKIIRE